MNKPMHAFLSLGLCVVSCLVVLWTAPAISDPTIQVIKIASQEKTAVARMTDGQLKVIHPGDTLPSLGKITSISAGRITVVSKKNETFIIRLDGDKQVINKINKVDPTAESSLHTTGSISEQKATGTGFSIRKQKNKKQ